MKNIMKYFNLAVLLVAMATMTGCMKEDLEENSLVGDITLTASVKLDTDNGSKQLSETGVKTFAEGEQVAVVYTNSSDQIVKATSVALTNGNITNEGKAATFTVTLTNPKNGTVKYVYPASMVDDGGNETAITSQNGTLESLSSLYDYAYGTGSFDGSSLPNITLTNQFAIGKITMKNYAGSSDLSDITGVTVTDGTNTYTITPASTPMTWPIYVAMKPVSNQTITVTATGSSYNYTKTVTDKTLTAGNMYTLTVKMGRIINLASLDNDFTAIDGDILTGTLAENHKISIADGATVTLKDVNINGSGTWTSGDYAGITCLGDATIILSGTNTVKGFFYEDYPGIQAAAGKTLIINGTGSLTAIGSDWGAGIGGGWEIDCGNIEIQGGTITATGGTGCAGIGAGNGGYNVASCGNITISGGTIEATGGDAAAGIGSGTKSSCGNITITSGVTSVTAIKGDDATYSIGAGVNGSCGTVTIGGSTGAITTSPYIYPVPITYPIALGDATSDYVGSVVTTDGNVYATVAAASAASKTAVAIIAYVGTAGSVDASSDSYKGLAIALSDANSGNDCQWAEEYADCLSGSQTGDIATALGFKNGIACTGTLTIHFHTHDAATAAMMNNGTPPPTGTSGWFMPSMGQWNLIVQGLATKKAGSAVTTDLAEEVENNTYKADNLNSVITDAGGTGFQKNSYWASTEKTFVAAWAMHFWYGYASCYAKNTNRYVRSVIAF